jgi:hypothetical protein
MTTTKEAKAMNDVTDILDRLRARKKVAPVYSGSVVRSSGPNTPPISVSQPSPYPTTLVNPDGEEAAKLIETAQAEAEALRAEVERLRGEWPSALMEQSCCLGLIGKNVIIDCETRAEAEEVLDWLCGERIARTSLASEPGK